MASEELKTRTLDCSIVTTQHENLGALSVTQVRDRCVIIAWVYCDLLRCDMSVDLVT